MTEPLIIDRAELSAGGTGWRAVTRLVQSGGLVRLRPGRFIDGTEWAALTVEQRAILRAHAHLSAPATRWVFSHTTAAAIHGLALVRADDGIHTTATDERGGARSDVVRHRGPLADGDIELIDGMPVTSVSRTLADLARTAAVETAVAALDAALGRTRSAEAELRSEIAQRVTAERYGVAKALDRLHFADPTAQRPGESISRLYLARAGFQVRSQIPIRSAHGTEYAVDFLLDDRVLGEFDGQLKYADPAMRGGRTAEEVVWQEKRREDWIRGASSLPVVRWAWEDLSDPAQLTRRLAAFGVRPQHSRGGFLTAGGVFPAPR